MLRTSTLLIVGVFVMSNIAFTVQHPLLDDTQATQQGESRSAALMDPDFAASKEIPDAHNQYIKQQKKHGHGQSSGGPASLRVKLKKLKEDFASKLDSEIPDDAQQEKHGGESSGTEDTEEAVNRHDKIKYISRSIYKRRPKKPAGPSKSRQGKVKPKKRTMRIVKSKLLKDFASQEIPDAHNQYRPRKHDLQWSTKAAIARKAHNFKQWAKYLAKNDRGLKHGTNHKGMGQKIASGS